MAHANTLIWLNLSVRKCRIERLWPYPLVFIALLLLPMVIPSDWTQDVPARYEKRHPGMGFSAFYPKLRRMKSEPTDGFKSD